MAKAAAPPPAEAAVAEPPSSEQQPQKRFFRASRGQPRLTSEQIARQGRVVSFALQSFTAPAAAMDYLNTDQAGLGRPLDLAIASADGLAAVQQALALRARPSS
jgi:uncharacterized protein (DUF2384 family)